MRAKNDSVDLTALRDELSCLIPLIDVCYSAFGVLAICTATTNGHHMKKSLHYQGLALDLRVKNLGDGPRQRSLWTCLKRNIDQAYPGMYDVLLESPGEEQAHVHIEASPILLAQIHADGVVTA
jgi:hypothetical protein